MSEPAASRQADSVDEARGIVSFADRRHRRRTSSRAL